MNEFVQSTITGTVTDEQGLPLPGASIVEKGTRNGFQANFDGNFSIVVSTDATLVVSYIGFKTKEILVDGQSSISIMLAADAEGLDEVVVIGFWSFKKSDLTGAVVSADIEPFRQT